MNSNDIQSRKILHGIRIAILVRAPAIRTLNDIKQFYVKKISDLRSREGHG